MKNFNDIAALLAAKTTGYISNEMIVETASAHHNPAAMQRRTVGRMCQTLLDSRSAFHRDALQRSHQARAFTLIELLVVIAIIAILIGLLFPAFRAVQDQAKRTQAKNDLTQIVNAVNAYYTDYGKYPTRAERRDHLWHTPSVAQPDQQLTIYFTLLRAIARALHRSAREVACHDQSSTIVFISPPDVKEPTQPEARRSGVSPTDGKYYDPWGTPYNHRD